MPGWSSIDWQRACRDAFDKVEADYRASFKAKESLMGELSFLNKTASTPPERMTTGGWSEVAPRQAAAEAEAKHKLPRPPEPVTIPTVPTP